MNVQVNSQVDAFDFKVEEAEAPVVEVIETVEGISSMFGTARCN